jgi:hypothetical protein
MPSVSISVDGAPVATVGTDGRTAVSVHAGGTRVDEDYADLSVSGGVYGRDDKTEHRIWVSCKPLSVGQAVEVAFMEIGGDSGSGQTIEELFPDQPTLTRPTAQENAEMFAEVRSARVLRDGYSLEYTSSAGIVTLTRTNPEEHGFGFSVLWTDHHPERVSVSLHSYTIDSVEQRGPGRSHVQEKILVGTTVRLAFVG